MTAVWTVQDGCGQLLPEFTGPSPREVGRRILPERYDAFRLAVSSSYREHFDRAVARLLEREGWQIVRIKSPPKGRIKPDAACAHAA